MPTAQLIYYVSNIVDLHLQIKMNECNRQRPFIGNRTDSFSRAASSIQSKFSVVQLALLLLHYVNRMQPIFRANFNILWAGQHEIRMQPGAWLVNSSTATELESRCEFAWATTAPDIYGLFGGSSWQSYFFFCSA